MVEDVPGIEEAERSGEIGEVCVLSGFVFEGSPLTLCQAIPFLTLGMGGLLSSK